MTDSKPDPVTTGRDGSINKEKFEGCRQDDSGAEGLNEETEGKTQDIRKQNKRTICKSLEARGILCKLGNLVLGGGRRGDDGAML